MRSLPTTKGIRREHPLCILRHVCEIAAIFLLVVHCIVRACIDATRSWYSSIPNPTPTPPGRRITCAIPEEMTDRSIRVSPDPLQRLAAYVTSETCCTGRCIELFFSALFFASSVVCLFCLCHAASRDRNVVQSCLWSRVVAELVLGHAMP
jgi:hypothetical protein